MKLYEMGDNRKNLNKLRLRVSMSSDQGGRKYMEDHCTIIHYKPPDNVTDNIMNQSFIFVGIFDGHGGDKAAQFSRENLCRNIIRYSDFWSRDDDQVCNAIHKGFVYTQCEMLKQVGNWPKTSSGLPSTSGTTASVLFIMNGKYYTGHVGDSRIVLGRKDKFSNRWTAHSMTRDHKPESPRERKRIEQCGGQVIAKAGIGRVVWYRPKRNVDGKASLIFYDVVPFLAVARSLGDLWSYCDRTKKFIVSPEPDVKCVPIDPSDKCLLLASDGLWNMMTTKAAMKVIHDFEIGNRSNGYDSDDISGDNCQTLPTHASTLLDICLNRWSESRFRADNTTVMAIILDQLDQSDQSKDSQLFSNSFYELDDNDDEGEENDYDDCDDGSGKIFSKFIGDTMEKKSFDDQDQNQFSFLKSYPVSDIVEDETALVLDRIMDKVCWKSKPHNNSNNNSLENNGGGTSTSASTETINKPTDHDSKTEEMSRELYYKYCDCSDIILDKQLNLAWLKSFCLTQSVSHHRCLFRLEYQQAEKLTEDLYHDTYPFSIYPPTNSTPSIGCLYYKRKEPPQDLNVDNNGLPLLANKRHKNKDYEDPYYYFKRLRKFESNSFHYNPCDRQRYENSVESYVDELPRSNESETDGFRKNSRLPRQMYRTKCLAYTLMPNETISVSPSPSGCALWPNDDDECSSLYEIPNKTNRVEKDSDTFLVAPPSDYYSPILSSIGGGPQMESRKNFVQPTSIEAYHTNPLFDDSLALVDLVEHTNVEDADNECSTVQSEPDTGDCSNPVSNSSEQTVSSTVDDDDEEEEEHGVGLEEAESINSYKNCIQSNIADCSYRTTIELPSTSAAII